MIFECDNTVSLLGGKHTVCINMNEGVVLTGLPQIFPGETISPGLTCINTVMHKYICNIWKNIPRCFTLCGQRLSLLCNHWQQNDTACKWREMFALKYSHKAGEDDPLIGTAAIWPSSSLSITFASFLK